MKISRVLITCLAAMAAGCIAASAEDVLTDDFSENVPDRWELAFGGDWEIGFDVVVVIGENERCSRLEGHRHLLKY